MYTHIKIKLQVRDYVMAKKNCNGVIRRRFFNNEQANRKHQKISSMQNE